MLLRTLYRRARNKVARIAARFDRRIDTFEVHGPGPVVAQTFSLANGPERFYYRHTSIGDRGSLSQVFLGESYAVHDWPQGAALDRYYKAHAPSQEMLIIDAGANIGAGSVYFCNLYPKAHVVAIEPERANCDLLRLNMRNRPVSVVPGAIGSTQGRLFLQDPGLSDWGFRVGDSGDYEVDVYTMDQVIREHAGDATPFIAKLDIEGSEQAVFENECLWLIRFPLIIIELHDWMLPGQSIGRHFYRQISALDFDILQRGENTFCFNNQLLAAFLERS